MTNFFTIMKDLRDEQNLLPEEDRAFVLTEAFGNQLDDLEGKMASLLEEVE